MAAPSTRRQQQWQQQQRLWARQHLKHLRVSARVSSHCPQLSSSRTCQTRHSHHQQGRVSASQDSQHACPHKGPGNPFVQGGGEIVEHVIRYAVPNTHHPVQPPTGTCLVTHHFVCFVTYHLKVLLSRTCSSPISVSCSRACMGPSPRRLWRTTTASQCSKTGKVCQPSECATD
jgi:hypothetical protein